MNEEIAELLQLLDSYLKMGSLDGRIERQQLRYRMSELVSEIKTKEDLAQSDRGETT